MTSRLRFAIGIVSLAILAVLLFDGSITSAAKGDRQAPTTPTNLQITAIGETHVTLKWNASTDNSGKLSYRVKITNLANTAYNSLATVAQTSTTYTLQYLSANTAYSFTVYAVDANNNRSGDSNPAGATTLADTSPPTKPVVQATVLGPSQVQLTWTKSTDTFPSYCCSYSFTQNGAPLTQHINWAAAPTGKLSVIIRHVSPGTTNSFTVSAIDSTGINKSTSDPVSASTWPSNDKTPPSVPTNLRYVEGFGCTEVYLGWIQSIDETDPQTSIEYEIYVNGVLSPLPVSAGVDVDFVYGAIQGDSFFTVKAVDRSGNSSAASSPVKCDWN